MKKLLQARGEDFSGWSLKGKRYPGNRLKRQFALAIGEASNEKKQTA